MSTLYIDTRHGNLVELDKRADGRVRFFPQGGGFSYSCPEEEFDKHFKVAPEPVFKLVEITGEWMDGKKFPAYSNGLVWNGWAMPHFEIEDARRMLNASGNVWKYDEVADAFTVNEGEEQEVYVAEYIWVDFDNGDKEREQIKVYAIGAGAWTWEVA